MKSFVLHTTTKIVFGTGEFQKSGEEAASLGKKAFLMTTRSAMERLGYLDDLKAQLKEHEIQYVVFNQVEPNPRVETLDLGVKMLKETGCDFLIALGGGSVMDGAKAIAAAAPNGGSVWDYVFYGDRKPREIEVALPILAIPTIAATSSETNTSAVVTNQATREKCLLAHQLLRPRTAIIDPELTIHLNRETTADGGIDILAHLVEPYFTGSNNCEIPDRLTESLCKVVVEYLPIALEQPDNIEARTNLTWASTLALQGIVRAGRPGPYPLHNMEHPISGHFDIAHGRGLAILIPRYMRLMETERPERFAKFARRVFHVIDDDDLEAARLGTNKMIRWLDRMGLYQTFQDVDVDPSKMEMIADDCMRVNADKEGYIGGPRKLDKSDVIEIFKMCLEKEKV